MDTLISGLIKRTIDYNKLKLDMRGSILNAVRSDGKDMWSAEETIRIYREGRKAWLEGNFEKVADMFGVLV